MRPQWRCMGSPASDPSAVRSIAVTVEDVVSALEMNQTSGKTAVLRITPPFSGRMRARLHVEGTATYTADEEPVHLSPEQLVADPPSYPRPAETEDALRSDPAEKYTVERHHERHTAAVADWRQTVADSIRDSADIETPRGRLSVSITQLGELPKQSETDE